MDSPSPSQYYNWYESESLVIRSLQWAAFFFIDATTWGATYIKNLGFFESYTWNAINLRMWKKFSLSNCICITSTDKILSMNLSGLIDAVIETPFKKKIIAAILLLFPATFYYV